MQTEATLGRFPFLNCITLYMGSLFLKTLPSAESEDLSQVVQVRTASFAGDMAVFLTWQPKEMIKVATAPGELVAESAVLDSEVRLFPCLGACIMCKTSRRLDTEESGIRVECPREVFFFFGWVKLNFSGLRPFTLEDTTRNQELSNCPYKKGREGGTLYPSRKASA